jgi:hypothetical protein
MSLFAMRSASSRRRRRDRRAQAGSSLISAIALTGILALLVVAGLSMAKSTTSQAAREGRDDIALQAADAGINRYISRLVEDPRYYDHYIDPAEDPRIDQWGVVHQPGTAWTAGVRWTYAGPPTTWVSLQDQRFGRAAYSLRVSPPATGSDIVTVQSTAQVSQDTPVPVTRSIQSQIRPTSLADFQMISNATIRYGAGATTTGKIYSAVDVNHQGEAQAQVYAQRYICSTSSSSCSGSSRPSSVFKAATYDSTTAPSFRDKFPTPIDFNQFTQARLDVKDAAVASGTYFNNGSVNAWLVQFLADGRAKVFPVTSTSEPGRALGTIGCPTTYNVSGSVAMYFEQSVIVSDGTTKPDSCNSSTGPRASILNGNVTIATKGNVYVGGNISYAAPGDDVLGLIAANEVVIAEYTPRNLTWRAATLAQAGQWRTNRNTSDGLHDTMTYIGSQTTADGGYASMFNAREYQYDTTLQFRRPYMYPVLEGSWSTFYWREVLPPA